MNLLGLLFDGMLAVLLVVTIGYCSRLSRRIRMLQDNRSELASMIAQFDQATGRAMTSLNELQTVSKRIADALQLKIEKANFLADDLAFLIEKSSKLAAQLEQAKSATVQKAHVTPAPATARPFFQSNVSPPKPKPTIYPPVQQSATDIPTSVKSAASLEALLNRLASSTGPLAATPPNMPLESRTSASQGPRTDAERELLEAIKSGR